MKKVNPVIRIRVIAFHVSMNDMPHASIEVEQTHLQGTTLKREYVRIGTWTDLTRLLNERKIQK